jgi:hypothetical protein
MIDQPQEEKPAVINKEKTALTVIIQSWWTPALAVLALVAGLLLGYFGRPMLNNGTDTVGDIAAVTTPVGTAAVDQSASPTATMDPTAIAENQKQLMDYLISNTVHFQGDPNALVTIIEFSDYQ